MNSKKSIVKQFLGFSMASWISAVISFVLAPIITRLINPVDLGKIDLFVTYCNMFVYASTLGMHQSYMRFYEEPPAGFDRNVLFSFSFKVSFIGGIIAGIVCFLFGRYFSNAIIDNYISTISIFMFLFIMSNTLLDFIKTEPRMRGNVASYTIIVVLMSLMAKLGYLSYKIKADIVFVIKCITVLYVILLLTYVIKYYKLICLGHQDILAESKKEIFRYALPTVPMMFISNVNASLPKIIINRYWQSGGVGIYAGTMNVVSIINLIQGGVNVFWTPFVFKNYKSRDTIIKVQEIIEVLITIFGCVLIFFQDIIFLILGHDYREGKIFYSLLLVSPVMYTISETVGIGINISKKTYLNVISTMMVLSVNMILCFLLVPSYGSVGAAFSVMTSSIVMVIFKGIVGEKLYRIDFVSFRVLFPVCFFVFFALVSYFMIKKTILRLFILVTLLSLFMIWYIKKFFPYIKLLYSTLSHFRKNNQ